jgi:osmotically-inducible protein OsmY
MYRNHNFTKNNSIFIFAFLLLLIPFLLFAQTSSEKLVKKVEDAVSNYYIQNFNISADNNGRIKIEGHVNSLYDKLRIFEIVSQVPGVKYIEDDIVVDNSTLPDDVIQQNIIGELKLVSSIDEPDRIKVKVDNGVVFLSGDVSYYREKEMAETVASWQQGVKGIVNEITVLPQNKAVSDNNLRTVIDEIIKNRFALDTGVSFTVNNGIVTLDGTANSMWDKDQLDKEISHLIGVKSVVNNLKIKGTEIG